MLANNMADNNDFVIITPSNRFNKDMLPMLKSLKLSVSMYSIDNFYIHLLNLYTGWKWDGLFHKGYSTSTRTGSNGQTLHGKIINFDCDELIKNNLEKRFAVICSLKRRKILRKEYPEYAKYFMDVSSVKGLEFDHVAVLLPGLTKIEQYIACTRTLNDLYIIK